MTISIIVATDKNGGIGVKGQLPWPKLKLDMDLFRRKTMNEIVIMGRKTYESLPNGLPGRMVYVLTRDRSIKPNPHFNLFIFDNLVNALAQAKDYQRDVWICGGAEVYREALPIADEIHLTMVQEEYPDCDRFFPMTVLGEWREQGFPMPAIGETSPAYEFRRYIRHFTR